MYGRILWMNDLSRRADACLGPIQMLARMGGAPVLLAHATGSWGQRGADAIPERLRAHARKHLQQSADALQLAGIPCEATVLPGKAEQVARSLIDEHAIDLLVAGSTGVTGLDRLLVGSTATRLLRKSKVPVLVVGKRPFDALEALLCPVDLDHADREIGILHATRLARSTDATVTFLAVLEAGTEADEMLATEKRLQATVEDLTGAPLERPWRARAVVDQSVATGILHAAKTHDIVVMSAHGKTGLDRLLTGSVAEDVVKSCHVSVLVAR